MNIIRNLQFPTTFTLKNQNWKLRENRFQELVQNLKTVSKAKFICFCLIILESEDSLADLELIISKATKYS